MRSRISISADHRYGPHVSVRFDGVRRALDEAEPGHIALLTGPWVYEEAQSYASSLGLYGYQNVIVGPSGDSLSAPLRAFYKGRSKLLDKVSGHLDRTIPQTPVQVGEGIELTVHTVRKICEEGIESYVKSRRVRDGAEEDAAEYLHFMRSFGVKDPLVMSTGRALTFTQLILYASWLQLAKHSRPRLVVCSEAPGSNIIAERSLTRTALTTGEAKSAIAEYLSATPEQTEGYYRIWTATQRRRASQETLRVFEVANFARMAEQLHSDAVSSQDVAGQIPQFVPAPVMFQDDDGRIGLDRTAQQGADPMHVRGAARALKHQVQDLGHAGIENAIPRAGVAFTRIAHILERLERKSPTEQADIIELGVEVACLGRRAAASHEVLGDYAASELVGFLTEANTFVRRFDTWKAYEEASETPVADAQTAGEALLLLESALKKGMLTPEARERLTDSFVSSPDLNDAGSREGVARTTDSLTAAVGRRALKTLKGAGVELEKEGTKRVVDYSLDFVADNSESLLRFAATRAPWIGFLLRFLIQTPN